MLEKIGFKVKKSQLGSRVLKITDGNKPKLIGILLNLDQKVNYLHLSEDCAPTYERKDGSKVKVPVGEPIRVFDKDRLYFERPHGPYYIKIKANGNARPKFYS